MKSIFKASSMTLCLGLGFGLLSQTSSALPVFINELHYDNRGADQNEFVEVAGRAGTDLSGWALEFYNGGNGRQYMTWALGGTITEEVNGWGALAFTGPGGMQNGTADGIALVDSTGVVQQFLSYEGTLTASNSTAFGLTSVDIGVSESGSTPLGNSLYLTGAGREDTDFTWSSGIASSGLLNVGQSISPLTISALDPTFSSPVFSSPAEPELSLPDTYTGQAPESVVAVSEPGSLAMLLLGLGLIGRSRFGQTNREI